MQTKHAFKVKYLKVSGFDQHRIGKKRVAFILRFFCAPVDKMLNLCNIETGQFDRFTLHGVVNVLNIVLFLFSLAVPF